MCDSLRLSHPWCHQCSPVLFWSVILSDTCLFHCGNDLAAVLTPSLRNFIFSSLVDSTHPCFSTFVLRLGMQLRLGHRIPCASKRACYRSLRFHSYLFAAASPPWPIVSTPWLPLLVPRLTHAHRPARLAARRGAVYSTHPPNPHSIHLRTHWLRVTAPLPLATGLTWSRLFIIRDQHTCSPRLTGYTSACWIRFGLQSQSLLSSRPFFNTSALDAPNRPLCHCPLVLISPGRVLLIGSDGLQRGTVPLGPRRNSLFAYTLFRSIAVSMPAPLAA
jgi:hypothetical protein